MGDIENRTAPAPSRSPRRRAFPALIVLATLIYAAVKLFAELLRPSVTALRDGAVPGPPAVPNQDLEPAAVGSKTSRADVQRRLDKYMINHYLDLHVAVVGVTLGVAGLVAASLLTNRGLGPFQPVFAMLWVASLMATMVAYSATVTGAIALPARVPSMLDLIPPMLISITESVLFAMLAPQLTGAHSARKILAAWFFCLAAFATLADVAIARARHLYRPSAYTDDLKPAVAFYRKILVHDFLGAGTSAAVGVAGGTIQQLRPGVSLAAGYWFAGSILVLLTFALVSHGRTARHWQLELIPSPVESLDTRSAGP